MCFHFCLEVEGRPPEQERGAEQISASLTDFNRNQCLEMNPEPAGYTMHQNGTREPVSEVRPTIFVGSTETCQRARPLEGAVFPLHDL